MDIKQMLAELQAERGRIDQAIRALEAIDTNSTPTGTRTRPTQATAKPTRRGRRRMSAATKRKLSLLAKARWAERKQAVPKQPRARRRISAAGRRRIAEAAKKMWAERRKKANAA